MLSVVIAAEKEQWPVVSTLAALVPSAAAGVVRDVVMIDRHGVDGLSEIADIAGCDFHTLKDTRGAALAAGARRARGPWLMFISPGAVPEPGWADEAAQFIQMTQLAGASRAATFLRVNEAYAATTLIERLRMVAAILGGGSKGEGLVISKSFYEKLGGHRSDANNPERDLMSRVGRRHCATLRARLTMQVAPA